MLEIILKSILTLSLLYYAVLAAFHMSAWVYNRFLSFRLGWIRRFRPEIYQALVAHEAQRITELVVAYDREWRRQQEEAQRAELEAVNAARWEIERKEQERKKFLDWLDYSSVECWTTPAHSTLGEVTQSAPPSATINGPSEPFRISDLEQRDSADLAQLPLDTGNVQEVQAANVTLGTLPYPSLVNRFKHAGVHLYHFTDAANWESIRNLGGLFSRIDLEDMGVVVSYLSSKGSRIADDRRGLSSFVHLSFHPDHSMLTPARYRTSESVVLLQISLTVLNDPGCCFTRSLAHAVGAVRIPVADISQNDLDQILSETADAKKWQLLVPGNIPIKLIREYARHERLIPLWQ